ncbi:hypothetical protein E2C01_054030 [Portunus trituberculatus]|uniref:Uncharacterized protein n=1 Tax=Portunus trituberculatus TaxID=210409 RepID=A0A5B7GRN4_PORTR|nr:hypothetical protein [Portunus trituberculatus]
MFARSKRRAARERGPACAVVGIGVRPPANASPATPSPCVLSLFQSHNGMSMSHPFLFAAANLIQRPH